VNAYLTIGFADRRTGIGIAVKILLKLDALFAGATLETLVNAGGFVHKKV
jgi:hypothetical protein